MRDIYISYIRDFFFLHNEKLTQIETSPQLKLNSLMIHTYVAGKSLGMFSWVVEQRT